MPWSIVLLLIIVAVLLTYVDYKLRRSLDDSEEARRLQERARQLYEENI